MSTPFESLDDALNISREDDVVDITPVGASPMKKRESRKPVEPTNKEEDREKDYQYARAHLYDLVEKMQETLNGAMEVAQESDHPRAFEVVFQGAKHTADIVDKLQDLQKKQKALAEEEVKVNQTNVQNNVFMTGTTADMLKMLKETQQNADK